MKTALNHVNFYALIFVFASCLCSCNLALTNGHLGASKDINDAKKREVFVCEYTSPTNPYRINDTLSIPVRSAWLEHQWRYKGLFSEKSQIEDNGYQLIVISDNKNLKGLYETWTIGLTSESYFRPAANDAMITDFETLPSDSVLTWKVQQGRYLSKSYSKNVIGKFELRKVN
ncbi:hypothetical protein [Hufsiella ginkgonis]|uniref:Lipoprotein n=1 Tax=Hufsiella ginkgonis TaxID=2695274 RepID=A0A7K1XSC5_9SPHI|nr:hypothetical protein [Hufsiella ginkgonis]MXV13911.1 hypothetical protein [Hufsiella ginkgonis]